MSDDVLGPAAQARIRTRIEEGAPLSEFDRRLYERAILRRHAWALALVNTRYTPPSSRTANAVNHGETFLQALADVGASFRRRLWSKPGVGTRVYIGSDGYVSIGQDGTLREVSRGVVTFDPRSLFLYQRAKYREAVALYLQRLREGAAGGQSDSQARPRIRFRHSPGAFGNAYREPRGTLELHVDGVYAGEAGFLRYPDRTDIFSLEHVIIEPAFQKRGLGKLLVARMKKYANERAPAVKYVSGDLASRASLRMMISALGPPLMIDNGVRCVSIAEAERILPAVSRTTTGPDRRTVIDSGAPIHAIFWIGRGRRPAKSPFPCD